MTSEAPSNRKAELGVIGCCLLGGQDTVCAALDALPRGDFACDDTREAFDVLQSLLSEGKPVNEVTFFDAWRLKQGHTMPMEIIAAPDEVPSKEALGHFAAQVLDSAARRRLYWAAYDVLNKVGDESEPVQSIVAEAEAKIFDGAPNLPKAHTAKECNRLMIDDLEARIERRGQPTGIITGLTDLDNLLDGLQFGEQTIIAARPSQGKTAIGLQIFERAALMDGIPSLFVTLEMGIKPLMRRLAAMHARIPLGHLRRGMLTEGEMQKIGCFSIKHNSAPAIIVDAVNGATDAEIASSIRRAVRLYGARLVVIDYLQKIKPANKQEKRTYEVGQTSGTLKSMADKCGVALLTLAQLNRESEKGQKGQVPRLCELAESAQIERDADVVGLLHRDRATAGAPAKLIIAKNRDGELGTVHLAFLGEFCRFENAARDYSV